MEKKTNSLSSLTLIDNTIVISCDSTQHIVYINDFGANYLKYEKKDIIGKHISILMTNFMKTIHENVFKQYPLETIRQRVKHARNEYREFVVLNALNETVTCDVQVEMNENFNAIVYIIPNEFRHMNSPQVPKSYLKYITLKPELHIDTFDDIICIMMDISNSTVFGENNAPNKIAELYFNVYKIANKIIKNHLYPYAYIHETCGDSIFVIANSPFVKVIKKFKIDFFILLSIKTMLDLVNEINNYLETIDSMLFIRCGITMGTISGGVIDGKTFRVFGSTVNKASRLESCCKKNHVTIDNSIKKYIDKYTSLLSTFIETEEIRLKGFKNKENIYHLSQQFQHLFKTI